MELTQQEQLDDIVNTFKGQFKSKFMKGQKEHGGYFYEKPMLWNLREECLDMVAYSHVLEIHQEEILHAISMLMLDLKTLTYDEIETRLEELLKQVGNL